MPNLKYTDRKTSTSTAENKALENGQTTGSTISPETPEVEEVEVSDLEDDHSNPGGTSAKQYLCRYCPKSNRKKGNLCRHEQLSHRQALNENESVSSVTLRPKKKANPDGEAGPRKKSKGKEAELALEDLLSEEEEPNEAAMTDMTIVNEQYRSKTPEEPPSEKFQRQFKPQVESTKELVESLLAALDHGDEDEKERVKWYAKQCLQNLENAGISSPSMTSVTEVELSDEEVTIVDVKEAPKAAEVMDNIEENDVEPNEELAPPEPSVAEQQVTDLIRQAAISAKIIPTELTVDTSTIEPGPVVTLDTVTVVRSEPRRSDEGK